MFNKPVRIISSIICGYFFIIWSLILIVLLLPCSHEWVDATCTEPKHCSICDETQGEVLGHDEGEWTLTTKPTLIDEGVEELLCTRCHESIDSRKCEKKEPKVDGDTFNFTDEEFIEWFNHLSTAELEDEDLELFDTSKNTSYRIRMPDGEVGAIVLNHENSDNIRAVMVYFEEWTTAAAIALCIGENIDSDFSFDNALYPISYGYSYTAAGMTVERLEIDTDFEVTVLAPTEFFKNLLN